MNKTNTPKYTKQIHPNTRGETWYWGSLRKNYRVGNFSFESGEDILL